MSAATDAKQSLKTNEKKWGTKVLAAGWTLIPTVLLEQQQQLGLDAVDLNLLLQIIKHWWYPDQAPFPSKRLLAAQLGVSPRTVQRRLKGLVESGLISRGRRKRVGGGNDTTFFYFDGLIGKVEHYAAETVSAREAARQDKLKKAKSKGLRLVKGD